MSSNDAHLYRTAVREPVTKTGGRYGRRMRRHAKQFSAITVDVFDTLLLRKPVSQTTRRWRIAEELEAAARRQFPDRSLTADMFFYVRDHCETFAFKALECAAKDGEVRFSDLVDRQLRMLGLPDEFAETMIGAEREIERRSVRPNKALVEDLRHARKNGQRVVAVSDTILSGEDLRWLLDQHIPDLPVDAIYSSADCGATKRGRELFRQVLARERLSADQTIHIGDDVIADLNGARECGMTPLYMPRGRLFSVWRRGDGAVRQLRAQVKRKLHRPSDRDVMREKAVESPFAFGQHVLGPLVAEYAMFLEFYLQGVASNGPGVALFCARGGLLMKTAYERFLRSMERDPPFALKDFMVSRLIATRTALETSPEDTFEELVREFENESIAKMAGSVAGQAFQFKEMWEGPPTREGLQAFLASEDGKTFIAAVAEQNQLFERHLSATADGAERLVIVDTGLFGSTTAMLQAGLPRLNIEAVQLARSNYKGLPTPHFAHVCGLWVNQDNYSPINVRSSVLRYWQLIEHVFEPKLQSVKRFDERDGRVSSNLESEGWRAAVEQPSNEIFCGVLAYLEELEPQTIEQHFDRLSFAWPAFSRSVRYPSKRMRDLLSIGRRSRDFGRTSAASDDDLKSARPAGSNFSIVQTALWKAGAAVDYFPRSYRFVQTGLELRYWLKWLMSGTRGTP